MSLWAPRRAAKVVIDEYVELTRISSTATSRLRQPMLDKMAHLKRAAEFGNPVR